MGIFNSYATFQADLDLLLQTAIIVVLMLGQGLKRMRRYPEHGLIMGLAVALHTVLIFAAMVPFLLMSPGLLANLSNRLALTVLSHSILGSIVEMLGIYLLVVWVANRGVSKACFRNKKVMRATILSWFLEFALGIVVYILLYLPS